jgi:hypothetical protein
MGRRKTKLLIKKAKKKMSISKEDGRIKKQLACFQRKGGNN